MVSLTYMSCDYLLLLQGSVCCCHVSIAVVQANGFKQIWRSIQRECEFQIIWLYRIVLYASRERVFLFNYREHFYQSVDMYSPGPGPSLYGALSGILFRAPPVPNTIDYMFVMQGCHKNKKNINLGFQVLCLSKQLITLLIPILG